MFKYLPNKKTSTKMAKKYNFAKVAKFYKMWSHCIFKNMSDLD